MMEVMHRRAALAFLLCAAGVTAQWGRTAAPADVSACPSVTLFPARATPVEVSNTGTVTLHAEAWCRDNLGVVMPQGLLGTSSCGSQSRFRLFDDRDEVSTLEAEVEVLAAPGNVQTLILVDLSNSVREQEQNVDAIKQGVISLLDAIFEARIRTGTHWVAVYTFDGRAEQQQLVGWTNIGTGLAAAKAAVNNLVCVKGTNNRWCSDPSTNLYGTLRWGAQELQTRAANTAINIRQTSRGFDNSIVIFTDGKDLAARSSLSEANAAIDASDAIVFAVGVASTNRQEVIDLLTRFTIDSSAAFVSSSFAEVPAVYSTIATRLVAYFSRGYRIQYCSPRRAGIHTLEVRADNSNTLGVRAGFVANQPVVYTPAGTSTGSLATIISFNGGVYQIRVGNSQTINSVQASELDWYYDASVFSQPPTCRNAPSTDVCAAAAGGVDAPFSCTGGATYDCGSGTCRCPSSTGTLCAASSCAVNTQTRYPSAYVDRQCPPPGLPQPGQQNLYNFSRFDDSMISLTFEARCADGTPIGGMTFSPCDDLSSIKLFESDNTNAQEFKELSTYESRPRITCVPQPAHITTLMLLDLSDSIRRGYGGLSRLKEMATAFLNGITTDVNSHTVAVFTFDGQRDIRLLTSFGSVQTALNRISSLQCDASRCADWSSNVNGAVIQGNRGLMQYHRNNPVAADGTPRQPFLALFTDGADQAQWYTDEAARQAAINGTGIFVVGLQGEQRSVDITSSGNERLRRGVDVQRLEALASGGIYIANTPAELQAQFATVGSSIASAAASRYRLDYCSPKRSGVQTVRVQLTHHNYITYWDQNFDADFLCADGRCGRCLGGITDQTFSCDNQPTPEFQNFVCLNGEPPVSRDGYCRCRCSDLSQYPPASQPGPGPIICETSTGTCASGDRISCTPHGGLPSGISRFSRFGIASNSRVSMEFVPTCADGWAIPSLRMSVCDSLTDFKMYETDPSGREERIDIFESEPRVVCYPDIISLILLDTSGSIQSGGGGINALRNAVVTYLRELQTSLTQVRQSVAIYAFDGREGVQAIMGFTTNVDQAILTMSSWDCGDKSLYCKDPSTNLYGATVAAESILRAEVTGFTWRQQPYLIIFTDGTDQAGRVEEQVALNSLTDGRNLYSLTVYGVGLQGETATGKGLNEASLRNLATGGIFVTNVLADLEQEFRNVAQQVIITAEAQQSTTYRIDYCSPKRQGLTTVTVELDYEGRTHRWQQQFNAGNFSCTGGSCLRCLSGRTYSCTDQPQYGPGGGDQQFFKCDVGDPLEHNGYCKCPCAGTYPPEQTPAPRGTVTPVTQTGIPSIVAAADSVALNGRSFANEVRVMIFVPSHSSAVIYYTTDGSQPVVTAAQQYTGQFTISSSGSNVVRAIAVQTGLTTSPVASATFSITSGGTPSPVTVPSGSVPPTCSSFTVAGFVQASVANGAYTTDSVNRVSSLDTHRHSSGNHFLYFCSSQGRWMFAHVNNLGEVSSGLCTHIARATGSGMQTAFVSSWEELVGSSYRSVAASFTCSSSTGPTATIVRDAIPITSNAVSEEVVVLRSIRPSAGQIDTARSSCVETRNPNILPRRPELVFSDATSAASVRLTAPAGPQNTQIRCTIIDTAGGSTPFDFPVTITGNPGTTLFNPPLWLAVRSQDGWPDTTALGNALSTILSAVRLNWICPQRECYDNHRNCPNENCRRINEVAGRTATVLDASDDIYYVQFQVNEQWEVVRRKINDDVERCWDGEECTLGNVQPASKVTPQHGEFEFGPDDDDGLEDWELALIIAGCVLGCCILLAIIYFCCIKKGGKGGKGKGKGKENAESSYNDGYVTRDGKSKGNDSYYDSYYSNTRGSESYYYDESYTPERFELDEPVQALYVDGEWYDATIYAQATDGTYEVKWYDGQHSEGIPADQLRRRT